MKETLARWQANFYTGLAIVFPAVVSIAVVKWLLLEFPRKGIYSVGFVTGEHHGEVQQKTNQRVLSVFVPTTPNPTGGYFVLVPQEHLTELDMTVADGIKFIISLGAVSPPYLLDTGAPSSARQVTAAAEMLEAGPKA